MWNHLEWYTANLSYFNTYSKLAERAQHYLKFRFKINIILDITQNKFCSSFFWHIDFNLNWNQCWCSETVFSLYICSVENLNSSAKEASQLLNVQWKKKKIMRQPLKFFTCGSYNPGRHFIETWQKFTHQHFQPFILLY